MSRPCYSCKSTDVIILPSYRIFWPRGQKVAVKLHRQQCQSCSREWVSGTVHDQNLEALSKRKDHPAYNGLMLDYEYIKLRQRYALSKKKMAELLGVSYRSYLRYEQELSYPPERIARVLKSMIESPELVKSMAEQKNIILWNGV